MAKYRKKPVIIEAEPYREGLEDGWMVLYTGNMFDYKKIFITKKECLDFIRNNKGKFECYNEDKNFPLIYEYPTPYINTLEGKHYIKPTDYIITGVKGEKYPCKKDIFEETYELAKE